MLSLTCMLCSTLRKSFIPVRCCTSWKIATSRVGVMAMERVSSTRAKRDHRKFKKPLASTEAKTWAYTLKTLTCLFRATRQRQIYLHHKLAGVSACHGGALSSCQDAYSPDIEGSRAKETPKDHSLKKQQKTWLLSHSKTILFSYYYFLKEFSSYTQQLLNC